MTICNIAWCKQRAYDRMWKFLDYIAEDGRVPIEDWSRKLSDAERAEFDVAIDYLKRVEDWDSVRKAKRKYRELTRNLLGLTEIKFSTTAQAHGRNSKKQFRPVGILKRAEKEFLFLGGFQKGRGGVPIPPDAFEGILKHKAEYERGGGSIDEHKT